MLGGNLDKIAKVVGLTGTFMLVFLVGILIGSVQSRSLEMPSGISDINPFAENAPERLSPYDWVKESQIDVFEDKVIINIKNPEWAGFADTNSMDPFIDKGANAIKIIPKTEEDIHAGDVISYNPENSDAIIIHRVIKIGQDEKGRYFVAKGDNNPVKDPEKIRFYQIKRVLVGVIY